MQEGLDILKVCVRVLAACNEKVAPYSPDVEALRKYFGPLPPDDLDELAYAVIIKAVERRAQTAMKGQQARQTIT